MQGGGHGAVGGVCGGLYSDAFNRCAACFATDRLPRRSHPATPNLHRGVPRLSEGGKASFLHRLGLAGAYFTMASSFT